MASFELKSKDGKIIKVDREWMRFGRSDDNDLVVPDPAVSRHHLNFYLKDEQLIVEDAGSQNGFVVNGTLASGAVSLRHGDKIVVGTHEYTVRVPGTPEPTPSAKQQAREMAATFTKNVRSDDPSKKRIRIYAIAAIALLAFVIFGKSKDPAKPKVASADTKLDKPLPADGFRPDTRRALSPTEIQSGAFFREGMRDYDNANYSRALVSFNASLTMNPENEDAARYKELAEVRLKEVLEALLKDANKSLESLKYRRAKFQASHVLTILSEEVPGLGRKVAQDTITTNFEQRRPPGQEETLLTIPCERTRDEKTCKSAIEIILDARKRLGEEDILK